MTFTPTPEQRKAIEHHTGPMLVVAGAGSGKTSVLVQRIAWLIREKGVKPEEILALTYSINAANRMWRGVQKALGGEIDSAQLRAMNFHSYCNQLLHTHKKAFVPLEEDDLKIYLNLHVDRLPLKVFSKAASPGDFIGDLLKFNERCQDDLVNADEYRKYVNKLVADPNLPLPRVGSSKKTLSREEVLARCDEIAKVYEHVTELLDSNNWGTFGNMIIAAVDLLRTNKEVLDGERAKTKFILVDEFQDSNFAQMELVHMLAGEPRNVFAVGDPDQAIYRFRGATSAAFDEFRKRFPETETATLTTNYRSTPMILKTAYVVIKENKMAGREPLVSGRAAAAASLGKMFDEAKPETVVTPDPIAEAKSVVESIEAMQAESGCKWSDFAVLYRQHDHRTEAMEELAARGIPYEVRNTDVLGAPEVRDALAVMRALARPEDTVSYVRLASLSRFKVDGEELKAVIANTRRPQMEVLLRDVRNGKRVLDALAATRTKVAKSDALGTLKVVAKDFALPDTAELEIFRKSVARWQSKPTTEKKTSLEDYLRYIDCLISVGSKVSANADGDEQPEIRDAVQLMSAHAVKGLEFKHVFVVRVNSGSFPGNYREPLFEFPWALSKSLLSPDQIPPADELHKQEERRLFYVSCTRAEDTLAMYGRPHWQSKQPTGFIKELNADAGLADVLLKRKVDESRVGDLKARAEALSPVSEWVQEIPMQMQLERLRLSSSAIECYDSCGLKYWLRYIWKLPEEPAATLQFGSVIHAVLKGYFDAVQAGKTLKVEQVLTAFRDGMESAHLEDQHQLKLYLEQGEQQLRAFVGSREGMPQPKVLATEKSFSFELDDVVVQGRMDRLDELPDGSVRIEDYKTGRAKSEKFAEDSLQLTIYAMAAKREGMRTGLVSIYNLENNAVIEVDRSDADLKKGENLIRKAARGIRGGKFEAKPGFGCRWCAYASICPAKEERVIAVTQVAAAVQ